MRDDKLLFFLSLEIGQGTADMVHGKTLKIESEHRHLKVDIAAKLAFTNSQQAHLELQCKKLLLDISKNLNHKFAPTPSNFHQISCKLAQSNPFYA